MPNEQEVLKDWHEFYLLIGTAAAALVALLFVAASISAGFLTPNRAGGHFTSVLFLSLVTLIPAHAHLPLGRLIGVNAGLRGRLSHHLQAGHQPSKS
jgi:hypothetical protein